MRYFKDHFDGVYAVADHVPAGGGWEGISEAEYVAKLQKMPTPAYSCTPWKIRKALNAMGLREQIEAAVAASDDQDLKDGWEFATEFCSDDTFVLTMGRELGKSAEETAALIQYASTL